MLKLLVSRNGAPQLESGTIDSLDFSSSFSGDYDVSAFFADCPAACEVAPAEENSVLGGLVAGPAPEGLKLFPEDILL